MKRGPHILITCEHASRRVPAAYRECFVGHEALLGTHRGSDFGSLAMARDLAEAFAAPLYAASATRLLVDLNRSVGHPHLHSEATRGLSLAQRREIVRRYYRPHRDRAEGDVQAAVERGERVLHIASHSFTPVMNGEVRDCDVGLLYDPKRPGERALVAQWLQAIRAIAPALRLRLNYPYAGKGDGLTSLLRRRYSVEQYVGIEVEINQRFVLRGGAPWHALRHAVVQGLRASMPRRAP